MSWWGSHEVKYFFLRPLQVRSAPLDFDAVAFKIRCCGGSESSSQTWQHSLPRRQHDGLTGGLAPLPIVLVRLSVKGKVHIIKN